MLNESFLAVKFALTDISTFLFGSSFPVMGIIF